MKKKIEKTEKTSMPAKQEKPATQSDGVYRELNMCSFQKNFTALIGHYKRDQQPSRVG